MHAQKKVGSSIAQDMPYYAHMNVRKEIVKTLPNGYQIVKTTPLPSGYTVSKTASHVSDYHNNKPVYAQKKVSSLITHAQDTVPDLSYGEPEKLGRAGAATSQNARRAPSYYIGSLQHNQCTRNEQLYVRKKVGSFELSYGEPEKLADGCSIRQQYVHADSCSIRRLRCMQNSMQAAIERVASRIIYRTFRTQKLRAAIGRRSARTAALAATTAAAATSQDARQAREWSLGSWQRHRSRHTQFVNTTAPTTKRTY